MLIERIRCERLNLPRDAQHNWSLAPEVEEPKPPVGNPSEDELGGFGEKCEAGDDFLRSVLLYYTGIMARIAFTTRD